MFLSFLTLGYGSNAGELLVYSSTDADNLKHYMDEFQKAHPERIAAMERQNLTNDPDWYVAAYRVLAQSDLAEELHHIKAKTLVTTGEFDIGSKPRMATLMHERIADSQLMVLPGLRHSLLAEAPEVVANLIRRFLDGEKSQ